jgi:hypothetical protein
MSMASKLRLSFVDLGQNLVHIVSSAQRADFDISSFFIAVYCCLPDDAKVSDRVDRRFDLQFDGRHFRA